MGIAKGRQESRDGGELGKGWEVNERSVERGIKAYSPEKGVGRRWNSVGRVLA